jgi:hypothetical protein
VEIHIYHPGDIGSEDRSQFKASLGKNVRETLFLRNKLGMGVHVIQLCGRLR